MLLRGLITSLYLAKSGGIGPECLPEEEWLVGLWGKDSMEYYTAMRNYSQENILKAMGRYYRK